MSLVGMRTLVRTGGGGALLRAVARRLRPYRLRGFADLHPDFAGRTGLELGGPSPVFGPRGSLPVYPLAARIDNVNFGHRTTWEGEIREGDTFVFRPDADPGRQFVAEAGSLPFLADAAYDFVLSSHCLEHLANPWRRWPSGSASCAPGLSGARGAAPRRHLRSPATGHDAGASGRGPGARRRRGGHDPSGRDPAPARPVP